MPQHPWLTPRANAEGTSPSNSQGGGKEENGQRAYSTEVAGSPVDSPFTPPAHPIPGPCTLTAAGGDLPCPNPSEALALHRQNSKSQTYVAATPLLLVNPRWTRSTSIDVQDSTSADTPERSVKSLALVQARQQPMLRTNRYWSSLSLAVGSCSRPSSGRQSIDEAPEDPEEHIMAMQARSPSRDSSSNTIFSISVLCQCVGACCCADQGIVEYILRTAGQMPRY